MNSMNQELAFGGWSGILIMISYGLLMLIIGIVTYLRNKTVRKSNTEYYLGGKGLGLIVLLFTFYATQYSGNTIVGYAPQGYRMRSEEHTSELQSRFDIVCRLLLEKKKKSIINYKLTK